MGMSTTPLSQDDGILIHNYFALRQNLFDLAGHHKLDIHTLLNWFAQEHIQRAVELLTASDHAAHKAAAIAHFRHIADTTEDPVKRRRAATTLLRHLSIPAQTHAHRSQHANSAQSSPPPGPAPDQAPAETPAALPPPPSTAPAPPSAAQSPPAQPGQAAQPEPRSASQRAQPPAERPSAPPPAPHSSNQPPTDTPPRTWSGST
jgi:hypothetical protein